MTTIEIISESEARAWCRMIEAIDERARRDYEDVGRALQEVQQDADSTIVDELVKYGSQVSSSVSKVMEGVSELTHMVKDVMDKTNEMLQKGKDTVHNILRSVTKF